MSPSTPSLPVFDSRFGMLVTMVGAAVGWCLDRATALSHQGGDLRLLLCLRYAVPVGLGLVGVW